MSTNHHFVITAIGKDRPGIVSAVAEVLFHSNCNIEDSSMTILGGEFAVIMIVSAPSKLSQKNLQTRFGKVEKRLKLDINCRELKLPQKKELSQKQKGRPYLISLLGTDKPGLVYRVADLLAKKKINITDVNTKVIGTAKNPVYAMLIEIDLVKTTSHEQLKTALTRLGKKLNAEITIKPVDVFQL